MITYEFRAKGRMGIDGVEVRDGHLVATVDTEFPLDNVVSAIRMQKLTVSKIEPKAQVAPGITKAIPAPPPSSANETTTKGKVPLGGKVKKIKCPPPGELGEMGTSTRTGV